MLQAILAVGSSGSRQGKWEQQALAAGNSNGERANVCIKMEHYQLFINSWGWEWPHAYEVKFEIKIILQ